MRGKRAKELRRQAYGDMAARGTKYVVTMAGYFDRPNRMVRCGNMTVCTGLRAEYKKLKRMSKAWLAGRLPTPALRPTGR